MYDPELLFERLNRHDVDYVVVGGLAVVAHGGGLPTEDVDICCDFSVDNLMRLQGALEGLHPVHRMTPQKLPIQLTPQNCKRLKNLYIGTDAGQLDCLSEVKGLGGFEAVASQSVEIELQAGTCRVLSLDALIRAKEAMGRPRDHEAVIRLRAIKERLEQGG